MEALEMFTGLVLRPMQGPLSFEHMCGQDACPVSEGDEVGVDSPRQLV